jgi:drug/metabolite transporter (DMT)-like permease
VIGGALLLGEPITASLLLGAPLVLLGVYLGALSQLDRRTAATTEGVPAIEA